MKITASNHKEQNIFEHHLKSQFPTYLMKCIDTINDMLSIYIYLYVEDYNFFFNVLISLLHR